MLPSVTVTPKPRWARRKTARPQELLAAALDLFVERGFAATRLDDVAARAGVSKGTLYLYFENKEELFKAVVRENMLPLLGEAEAAIDAFQGHSADLFREIIMGWWERIGNTRLSGITKLMMAESGNFPEVARFYHEEVIRRADGMIRRLLERGMARGEFRRIDTAHATSVVIAPVLMLMMWKHSFTGCQPETIAPKPYLECVIDLLLNGVATSAPTGVALAGSSNPVATGSATASARSGGTVAAAVSALPAASDSSAASALPVASAPSEPLSAAVTQHRSPPHA